jgi:hypothetical protein
MTAGATSVGLGVLVHLVLSALFGMLFALTVPRLRSNGTVALAGTLYGTLLYAVNFVVLAPLAFTVFKMANQPFGLFAHIVSARCCRLRSSALAPAAASRSWPSDTPVDSGGSGERTAKAPGPPAPRRARPPGAGQAPLVRASAAAWVWLRSVRGGRGARQPRRRVRAKSGAHASRHRTRPTSPTRPTVQASTLTRQPARVRCGRAIQASRPWRS